MLNEEILLTHEQAQKINNEREHGVSLLQRHFHAQFLPTKAMAK